MNAKLTANPTNLLNEDFTADHLHPADIEQIIEAGCQEYDTLPLYTKTRKNYRNALNALINLLAEKRGFKQFSLIN